MASTPSEPTQIADVLFLITLLAITLSLGYSYVSERLDRIPKIIQPVHNSTISPARPFILWNTLTTKFLQTDIQISKESSFLNTEAECLNVPGTSCVIEKSLEPSSTYFIRSRSKNEQSTYPWSNPNKFFTSPVNPIQNIKGFN